MTYAYVGSWASFTDAQAEGIYAYRLDDETGALVHVQTVPLPERLLLAASPARSRLYAVTHSSFFEGEPGAGLVAFAVDGATGELTRLGHRVVPLPHPPHVSLDRSGRFLLVAAGLGGGIAVVRVADDGSLGDVSDVVRFPGEPTVPLGERITLPIHPRPRAPYPHSIQIDRGNRFVLVGDMGASRVAVFRLDPERGTLSVAGEPWAESPPGAPTDRPYGARHLDFHPDNRTVYVSTSATRASACSTSTPSADVAPSANCADGAGRLRRRERARGAHGPPVRAHGVRLEPRPRQHRRLLGRPGAADAAPARVRADAGEAPARLRPRPGRRAAARRQHGDEHGGRVRDRRRVRPARADGRRHAVPAPTCVTFV